MSEASIADTVDQKGSKKRAKKEPLPISEREVLTINEFCSRNLISKAHYFNLRDAGKGPRELRAGRRISITKAAELDWQHARETEPSAAGGQ